MSWFNVIGSLGSGATALVGLLSVLFALGLYKMVKDWLPF